MVLTRRQKQMRASIEEQLSKEDRISELPDDILVMILAILTSEEAGRMSVLSKKWRNVWAYITTLNFNFPCSSANVMLKRGRKLMQLQDRVDQVISLHKTPTIDELKLRFDAPLSYKCRQRIDDLLRYVVEKRVKKLELNFFYICEAFSYPTVCLTFPSLSCNSLTSLELSSVDITSEVLESYLRNCTALECLSVKGSESLEYLKVSGPLLNFKSLTVTCCVKMKRLEISAPVLVSFRYSGYGTDILFTSAPKLATVSLGYSYSLTDISSRLSFIRSQIEVLSINISGLIHYQKEYVEAMVFTRMKKLDVLARPSWNGDFCGFVSLIKACPFLQHFKLKLRAPSDHKQIKLRKLEGYTHNHLKSVEIVGFVGHAIDLEFAIYLLEKATSLDKMIVDTREVFSSNKSIEDIPRSRRLARARAERLREHCKQGTELEIL